MTQLTSFIVEDLILNLDFTPMGKYLVIKMANNKILIYETMYSV